MSDSSAQASKISGTGSISSPAHALLLVLTTRVSIHSISGPTLSDTSMTCVCRTGFSPPASSTQRSRTTHVLSISNDDPQLATCSTSSVNPTDTLQWWSPNTGCPFNVGNPVNSGSVASGFEFRIAQFNDGF